MTALMPNIYTPKQLEALQAAFDQVCQRVPNNCSLSREDLAQLIVALAADGGAQDRSEIDADELACEAMASVVEAADSQKQRDTWSNYSRKRAF